VYTTALHTGCLSFTHEEHAACSSASRRAHPLGLPLLCHAPHRPPPTRSPPSGGSGRAGIARNKFRMALGLPVGAVMNCGDNSGA
jgi:hypothetical protein